MDINEFLVHFNRKDYQKDNFDSFLNKVKFSYNVPSIHVTGTNGKGSVCNYLKNVYQCSRRKVGIFTSPDTFFEQIKINDECIEISYVEDLIKKYENLFKKYDLSSFEIQVFIALNYFQDKKVDLAIIECGMGGELDATNIFMPVLSIISTISIEHSSFLGESVSQIALHKSGIIKEDTPTLIGHINGDALDVIVSRCAEENSKLHEVCEYLNLKQDENGATFDYGKYSNLKINNPCSYSVYDATIALEAITILNEAFNVDESSVKSGLEKTSIKCRFERVKKDKVIILDGAHNPEGILKLREDIDRIYPDKKIGVIFASFKDKNITSMLPEISLIGDVKLTTFDNLRAREEFDYFLFLNDYPFYENSQNLLKSLYFESDYDIILITGSLAFAYEMRNEVINL